MTGRVLTPRQLQILGLMAAGLTRPQIAAQLWLGVETVKTHQRGIYAQLGTKNGPAAVAAGYRTGLLADPTRTRSQEQHVNDPNPLTAELKRIRQELRDTQRDLSEERQRTAELTSRLQALQIHQAIVRIPAQPPDPDGGMCEPILYERPVRDVPTGGVL